MSKRAIMSEAELQRFAERVYTYWHPHAWEDHMKDVACYVLDLLRQGYTVQGILDKLKTCINIARTQHDTLHTDLLVQFQRAIRRSKVTERWVWFHLSGPGRTERSSRVIRATGERADPSMHFQIAGFLTDQIEKGVCG